MTAYLGRVGRIGWVRPGGHCGGREQSLFDGLVESHECEWLRSVDLFRASESTGASTAFEDERTDFYKDALRIPDFGDELCLSSPTGDDYGYAHVMFRVDNLLVQVSYELQTHGSPARAAAKPRGMSLAKYVYGLAEAAA